MASPFPFLADDALKKQSFPHRLSAPFAGGLKILCKFPHARHSSISDCNSGNKTSSEMVYGDGGHHETCLGRLLAEQQQVAENRMADHSRAFGFVFRNHAASSGLCGAHGGTRCRSLCRSVGSRFDVARIRSRASFQSERKPSGRSGQVDCGRRGRGTVALPSCWSPS